MLGLDPRSQGVALRRRLGYLPGDFTVDTRQPVRELLTYLGNLHGGVPRGRIEALAARLDLDLGAWIRSLSKGNRQKVGLVQAFMHEPELLVLNEPTSGLDPLVQQEFLAMVREAKTAGRTVFMSSHVLSEVQQSGRSGRGRARWSVGRSGGGRGTAQARGSAGRDPLRRTGVRQGLHRPAQRARCPVAGTLLRCRLSGPADPLVKAAARFTSQSLLAEEPDLEELFLAYYAEEGGRGA